MHTHTHNYKHANRKPNKNKLKNIYCIHRYHKNQNITPTCVIVRKFDHDFKYAMYLIACSGLMELTIDEVPANPSEDIPSTATYTDTTDRQRMKTSCTGESHLTLRPAKFGKPDVHSNIAVDMSDLLNEKLKKGTLRPVFAAVVDGGVDYTNTRAATIFLLGQIFKDFGLEGLMIFRRCGGVLSCS
jgi:hypothetical protein